MDTLNLAVVLLFVAYTSLALPLGAIRTRRRVNAGGVGVSRQRLYTQTIVAGLAQFVWAILVARVLGVSLLQLPQLRFSFVLVGTAALVLQLLTLIPLFSQRNVGRKPAAQFLVPHTQREALLYALMVLIGGVSEETVYRGALFACFAYVLPGWWLPAMLSAAIFGAVHAAQGSRAAFLAGGFGWLNQVVVRLTGTLYLAMVIHILYDLIAAAVLAARDRKGEPQPC